MSGVINFVQGCGGGVAFPVSSGGGAGPQLFQAYTWTGASTAQATEASAHWAGTLPNPSGANNTYIFTLSYPTGTAPTISDTDGNTWPATPTKVISGGANDLAVWIVQGISPTANRNKIKATFGSGQQPVSGEIREWSGLATSGGISGFNTNAAVTAPSLSCGSFTPSSASVVFAFFYDAFGNDPGPTHFTASAGYSMMQGNSIQHGNFAQGQPMASSFAINPGTSNPGMTSNGETVTEYNCLAIAIPVSAGAGTTPPNTLRIVQITRLYVPAVNGATSATFNAPMTGNFRVFQTSVDDATVTGVSDSDGTYTDLSPGGAGHPAFYYLKNQSPDASNIVTITWAGGLTGTNTNVTMYDIAHANTGTVIGATGSAAGTQPGSSPTPNAPNITPTSTSSLILACFSNGLGPTDTISSPSGAQTANVIIDAAPVESDSGVNSGDETGYLYNTSLTAQSWTWAVANPGNTFNANAVEILP